MDREHLIELAEIADRSDRYTDMARYMRQISEIEKPLSSHERNLFSVAYKNVIGKLRASWRISQEIKRREGKISKTEDIGVEIPEELMAKLEVEMNEVCEDVFALIKDELLPLVEAPVNPDEWEAKTSYIKMRADYFRYKAEYTRGEEKDAAIEKARQSYEEATAICADPTNVLKPGNPICLGLALNYSVFHFEIEKDIVKANMLAKEAFDKGLACIGDDGHDNLSYTDTSIILQLIRDNLVLWGGIGTDDRQTTVGNVNMPEN